MSVELAKKYAAHTDEIFKAESKTSLLTNTDFDWTGARSVMVWKISTVAMNDYSRNRSSDYDETEASLSRFGKIIDLDAQTEEMLLTKDRSFIFNIDKLDQDETAQQLAADSALARQIREQVIPEMDSYVYAKMVEKAGTTAEALGSAAMHSDIYNSIVEGSEILDDAEVPDTERVLVVSPSVYRMLKNAPELNMDCNITEDMRLKGVISMVDGMTVVRVPSSRLPKGFGFMIAHPCATVAPVKLEDYGIHPDTALSSGTIVTGRVCYDAFVLENKAMAIYYQPIAE